MEFLVHMEVTRLDLSAEAERELVEHEARRAAELIRDGVLRLLWRTPGRRGNWGVWNARDADELHAAITSLPMFKYLSVTVHPLAAHPNAPQRPAQ